MLLQCCTVFNQVCTLRVPPFEKFLSDYAGQYIFDTVFHEDFINVDFIKIGPCPSTPKLACSILLSRQAGPILGIEGGCLIKKSKWVSLGLEN